MFEYRVPPPGTGSQQNERLNHEMKFCKEDLLLKDRASACSHLKC